jgi:uncharacterized protein
MKIKLLLSAFLISLKCAGQPDPNHPGTLLWKISKENSNHTSYIFGTQHQFSEKYCYKYPAIINLLNECDAFLCESDLRKRYSKKDIITHNPVPDSIQWHQLATKQQLNNIENYFKEEGLFDPKHEKLHLNYYFGRLMARQSRSLIMRLENGNGIRIIDYHLLKTAEEKKKTIHPFEEDDEFYELNKDLIANNYSQSVDLMIKKIAVLDSMVTQLRAGKSVLEQSTITALNNYAGATIDYSFEETPDNSLLIRSLKNRNERWMPELISSCNEHSTFIAVGYGHLQYTYGLITMLRNAGFKVEPVPMK